MDDARRHGVDEQVIDVAQVPHALVGRPLAKWVQVTPEPPLQCRPWCESAGVDQAGGDGIDGQHLDIGRQRALESPGLASVFATKDGLRCSGVDCSRFGKSKNDSPGRLPVSIVVGAAADAATSSAGAEDGRVARRDS